jgi:5-methylcytosine-specific restriction endonuclease McrA
MGRWTPEQKRIYQRDWKRRRYEEARRLLGGLCRKCGAVIDLEIDHIEPTQKEHRITDIVSRRLEVRAAELAKCQLLCCDCHSDKTDDDAAADVVPF